MEEFGAPKFTRLGSNVLILDLHGTNRLKNQERIWRLHARARAWTGVLESVPGMNNLTLLYDDCSVAAADLEARLREAISSAGVQTYDSRTLHVIDVAYGGDAGPDLPGVAATKELTQQEVVSLHTAREYVVYFVGFQPGFAYLGDVDDRLRLPRRDTPRAAVPPGSVAIAMHQTAVYPFASPGGWHIIGRTDSIVFDASSAKALFAPGDRVRFRQGG